MKDFWKEPTKKKLNKKKISILVVVIVIVILLIVISAMYTNNKNVRNWIDKNIFQKEKTQNNLPSIEIEESNTANIYAFNRYIGVLNKNTFRIFNSSGSEEEKLTLEITIPIFASNGKYLVVAEKEGQKLYLISDKEILWEREIEGNISQITVNKNGYVSVVISDTLYKTVVTIYDNEGENLFKTFSSSTRAVTTSISDDNKYLAIAQIDTSGTVVESNVKLVSIEEAKNNPNNSVKKVYSSEAGDLIINIKYQDNSKLVCMYTDKIVLIKTNNEEDKTEILQEYKDKKVSFASIELSNSSITIEEKASGIFTADSVVNIMNSENKNMSYYTAESVTKEIYTYNNVIALNLGAEVEFINTSGWLLKKYIAEQEITSIVLSDSVAGIIYRDKIEIIKL